MLEELRSQAQGTARPPRDEQGQKAIATFETRGTEGGIGVTRKCSRTGLSSGNWSHGGVEAMKSTDRHHLGQRRLERKALSSSS